MSPLPGADELARAASLAVCLCGLISSSALPIGERNIKSLSSRSWTRPFRLYAAANTRARAPTPSQTTQGPAMASRDEPVYGRRLAVDVVDKTAARDPGRSLVYAPRSGRPRDGWEPVTFGQMANAVNHVARLVANKVKAAADGCEPFPTLAYLGPSDMRFGIVMLACIKAGCQALFASPRNSVETLLSLFERTRCAHLWYAESFGPLARRRLARRPMQANAVAPAAQWLNSAPKPFSYDRAFEAARGDPLVVLHTSGSTGTPKPVVVRQGAVAVADGQRALPPHQGGDVAFKHWAEHATRVFMPMPLFHAVGLEAGLVTLALYYGVPIVLGMPDVPLTAELIVECLSRSGADAAFLPPSIIEQLSRSDEGVDALKRLRILTFGGGGRPTSPATGVS